MKADSLERLDETGLKDKEKITNAEIERMIRKFIKDTAIVYRLKADNNDLKKKIDALLQNNMKFAELVQVLEARNNRVRFEKEEELIYSYQDGGMVENDEIGKQSTKLHKKKLTLNEINSQLADILTKLEKNKE